jgi:hypothetical protein
MPVTAFRGEKLRDPALMTTMIRVIAGIGIVPAQYILPGRQKRK